MEVQALLAERQSRRGRHPGSGKLHAHAVDAAQEPARRSRQALSRLNQSHSNPRARRFTFLLGEMMRRKNRKWVATGVALYLFVMWSAYRWGVAQRPTDGNMFEHIEREAKRKN